MELIIVTQIAVRKLEGTRPVLTFNLIMLELAIWRGLLSSCRIIHSSGIASLEGIGLRPEKLNHQREQNMAAIKRRYNVYTPLMANLSISRLLCRILNA
jgi:hypothetical protein